MSGCCNTEHRSGSGSRLAYSSHERLDQLAGLSARQGSSSDMEARRPDSSPSLHRRGTGSGTEEDIFSAVGGLEIDGEHRSSSIGQGACLCCACFTFELLR